MKHAIAVLATLAITLSCLSGCASLGLNGPPILPNDPIDDDQGNRVSFRDAVIDAVLLVHPEFSEEEAEEYARQFYLEHKAEIDERRTQVTSAIGLINFMRQLLQAYGLAEEPPAEPVTE